MDDLQQEWLLEFISPGETLTDTPGRGPLSEFQLNADKLDRRIMKDREKAGMIKEEAAIQNLMERNPAAAIDFIHRSIDLELNKLRGIQREVRQRKIGM